jgi:hypothetical protein
MYKSDFFHPFVLNYWTQYGRNGRTLEFASRTLKASMHYPKFTANRARSVRSMDPGDDPPPEDEDGHKWWLCAEHYDQWTAPRPMRCTCGVDDHCPCDCTKPDFWDER